MLAVCLVIIGFCCRIPKPLGALLCAIGDVIEGHLSEGALRQNERRRRELDGALKRVLDQGSGI